MGAMKPCPDAKRSTGGPCHGPGCNHRAPLGHRSHQSKGRRGTRRLCPCCAKRAGGWELEAKMSMLAKYQASEAALVATEDAAIAKLNEMGPRIKPRVYAELARFSYAGASR